MPHRTSDAAKAAKLQGLLESAATAIVTIDAAGVIESVNPATERMFGYGPPHSSGTTSSS